MRDRPSVYIVIACWNNRALLAECFDSLRSQTSRCFRTVMVDNGSSDDSVAFTRACYPEVEVIEAGRNLGFSRANNIGIAHALKDPVTEFVMLLNTDARLRADWIEVVVRFASGHPSGAGFQSPTFDYFDHDVLDSAGITLDHALRPVQIGHGERHRIVAASRVFGVNAAAALYRRSFLEQQPFRGEWLDTDLSMYLEDVDISARAVMLGWHNYVVAGTEAFHMGSASTSKDSSFSVRMWSRNGWLVIIKNLPLGIIVRGLPGMIRSDVVRMRRLVRLGHFRLVGATLAGLLAGSVWVPAFYRKRRHLRAYWRATAEEVWGLMGNWSLPRRELTPSPVGAAKIVAVVVSRNHEALVEVCRAIGTQTHPNFEVVAVDMASREGTPATIESNPEVAPRIRPGDLKMGDAFNAAVAEATKRGGEYLALFTAEMAPDSTWLQTAAELVHAHEDCFAALAPATAGNGGRAGLYRMALFEQVGRFDPNLPPPLTEADIELRARLFGYAVTEAPTVVALTGAGASSFDEGAEPSFEALLRLYAKNLPFKLFCRHLPRFILANRARCRASGCYRALAGFGGLIGQRRAIARRRTVASRDVAGWLKSSGAWQAMKLT